MTVNQDSELPWPQCLGFFDEESCRFFLRQVGEKIVPAYPFSLGMEEVYGLILERYGFEDTSDAISVLQELLEDDETAAGLGDDGDVWRSWRHNWRHRNDDSHDPFIPRVGNLILRPPTTTRIRLLRAANFVACDTASQPVQVLLNRVCNEGQKSLMIAENLNAEAKFGPQETMCNPDPFLWKRSDNMKFARNQSISDFNAHFKKLPSPQHNAFRKLNSTVCNSSPGVNSSFDSGKLKAFRQSHSTTANDVSPLPKRCATLRGGEVAEHSPRKSLPSILPSARIGAREGTEIELQQDQNVAREKLSTSTRPLGASVGNLNPSLATRGALAIYSRDLSHDSGESQPKEVREVTSDSIDASAAISQNKRDMDDPEIPARTNTPNHNRRAANREVRLIDGALFNGRCTKEKATELICSENSPVVKATLKRSPQRLVFPPILQQPTTRKSWLRSFWSRFRRGNSIESSFRTHKRHQSFPGCVSSNIINSRSTLPPPRKCNAEEMPSGSTTGQTINLGMDGTFDIRSVSSRSGSDINKPLPLNPSENSRCSVSSEVQKAFFAQSDGNNVPRFQRSPTLSSRTSTISINRDLRSPKQPFMDLPDGICVPGEIDHQARPTLTELDDTRLPPSTPLSFTSIANQNPFSEAFSSATSVVPPLPFAASKNAISSDEWPFRRTANVDTIRRREEGRYKDGIQLQEQRVRLDAPSRLGDKAAFTLGISADNRKRTDDSKLNTCDMDMVHSNAPRARSRSPVKKFLGLSKGVNATAITASRSPTKNYMPLSNNTKRTLKQWSHKLRYGVLSQDEIQPRQEQMRQHYASHDDVHIATPSKSNRSTFPVSVRPVDQARILSEIELMICIAANKFLLREAQDNRITAESVARIRMQWESRNKPQVVEFLYDLATQRDLIMANLRTVTFHGDAASDAVALSSILHQWKVMAREMTPRTLCNPDSVIRRWLHDLRRILETLGASGGIMEICDTLSISMQRLIIMKERERMQRRDGSDSTQALSLHRRSASDDNCYKISHTNSPKSLPTRNGRGNNHQPIPISNSFTNGMRNPSQVHVASRSTPKLVNVTSRPQ